jgi:soluble lytic murein transglycosylase-like protein
MARAYAPPAQAQASLFGWLARNAAPPTNPSPSPPAAEPTAAQPAVQAPAADARPPRQALRRGAPIPRELDVLIAAKAQSHGVPVALAHAVVRIESNYNPRAVGGRALGLMQIKHATARGIGFTGSADDLFDPPPTLNGACGISPALTGWREVISAGRSCGIKVVIAPSA